MAHPYSFVVCKSELDARLRLNFHACVKDKVLRSTYRKSLQWEDELAEDDGSEEDDATPLADPEGGEEDEANDLDGEHVEPLDGPGH